jgi:hypothetical protein
MTEASYTQIEQPNLYNRRDVYIIAWTDLATGDTGTPADFCQYADRSCQVSGVWGGATMSLEGSNDGTNWHPLIDHSGNAIALTDDALVYVVSPTLVVRPNVTGGDVTTSLTITMLFRSNM